MSEFSSAPSHSLHGFASGAGPNDAKRWRSIDEPSDSNSAPQKPEAQNQETRQSLETQDSVTQQKQSEGSEEKKMSSLRIILHKAKGKLSGSSSKDNKASEERGKTSGK